MAESVNQDNVQSTSQLQANERVCEFSYKKRLLMYNNRQQQGEAETYRITEKGLRFLQTLIGYMI